MCTYIGKYIYTCIVFVCACVDISMCVCMEQCVYTCVCIYVCGCTCMRLHMCLYVLSRSCACMFVFVSVCCISIFVCACRCANACISVLLYVLPYIHGHGLKRYNPDHISVCTIYVKLLIVK